MTDRLLRTDPGASLEREAGLERSFLERVLEAVPVSQPAFGKLLALLDVRPSREIPTACVSLGARPRLLVNPDFVAEHCRTREALGMLVMHELLHVLLGHTRLFERVTPAHNLAFDALINAQLCLLFPSPAATALFRELYREDEWPWALLRPPPGWPGEGTVWPLSGPAGRIHRALYTETSVTTAELFAMLVERLSVVGVGPGIPLGERLLGSHDRPPGDAGEVDSDVARAIRDILARWPMHTRRSGRDEGGALVSREIRVERAEREAVNVLRRALRPLLDLGEEERGPLAPGRGAVPTVLPYRTRPDRRAEVRALGGCEPLFFRGLLERPCPVPRSRAHVYVDASGSMEDVLPLLYGALLPVLDALHPRIHLFSTRVEDVDPAALRRGRVRTSEGTAIGCVTAHLLDHRVARALVVTDGWVGRVPEEDARRLRARGVRVNCVITADGESDFAAAFRGRVERLPFLPSGRGKP